MAKTEVVEWTVTGMDCGSCAAKIKDAVVRLPGVSDVSVALMTERLKLTLDETATPRAWVEAMIRSLGYGIADRPAGNGVPIRCRAAPAADHASRGPCQSRSGRPRSCGA